MDIIVFSFIFIICIFLQVHIWDYMNKIVYIFYTIGNTNFLFVIEVYFWVLFSIKNKKMLDLNFTPMILKRLIFYI